MKISSGSQRSCQIQDWHQRSVRKSIINEGHLTETGGRYTFFWSGQSCKEHRETGECLTIKIPLLQKLASLHEGISDRLMTMMISSAHMVPPCPTQIIQKTSSTKNWTPPWFQLSQNQTKLLDLGDFNARVGHDHTGWKEVLGHHWSGEMQKQWLPSPENLCQAQPFDHQHSLSSSKPQQDDLHASVFQA